MEIFFPEIPYWSGLPNVSDECACLEDSFRREKSNGELVRIVDMYEASFNYITWLRNLFLGINDEALREYICARKVLEERELI
jgi:hypothetical protein